MAGSCKGAYLFAMLFWFVGLTGINGGKGTIGTTGIMGMVEIRVSTKGMCAVEGGV